MKLWFPINQHPLDGSAHALYCVRNAWWLAKARPETEVELIFPGAQKDQALSVFGLGPLPNLSLKPLWALRRAKGRRGITINWIYNRNVRRHLSRHLTSNDIVLTASFPKLFESLLPLRDKQGARFVYEVHQYSTLEGDRKAGAIESRIYAAADGLITTTAPLAKSLERDFPTQTVSVNGLACGFNASEIEPARELRRQGPFTIGYLGSLYEDQGVDWLTQLAPELARDLGVATKLKIGGSGDHNLQRLKATASAAGAAAMIEFAGHVKREALNQFLREVDALIIPALDRGRMPYVAITKAYDYLALRRPIVAANLPSINGVLTHDRDALLFAPGERASLTSQLRRLRDEAGLAERLTATALTTATQWTWEARAERHWEMLKAITNRAAASQTRRSD